VSEIAATNERRIICKVMTEKTIQPLLDRQVTGSWFYNSQEKMVLEWLLEHTAKYGGVPAKGTFQTHVGTAYSLFAVSESWDYLLDTQADLCRWTAAKRMLPDVEDSLTAGKTEEAIEHIQSWMTRINSYSPTSTKLVDSMENARLDERWKEYLAREAGGGIIGLTTGFPTIDSTTLGLQPGHLVTVLAQPKVGKTTLCLAMANHVYETYEAPILFVSFEMGIREMELRQESLMAGINFKHLQQGTLDTDEKDKYADFLDKAETHFSWPFHFMDASSGSTISAIRANIERLDPAVVFIDGIYMLTDEISGEVNTSTALTNITRSLKRTATQIQKPIVINTQALAWKSKGSKITMDSAGYSSSFSQDSDVVLGLERMKVGKDEDEDAYAYQRQLRVLASRNTGLASVELIFDYDEGRLEETT
jgi:replicative DNA helicase